MATVLFCAAHPDDETLAMGVAIAEHVAAGHDVHVLWMTRGEGSTVLSYLNGLSTSSWWGLLHNPAAEGYTTLDAAGIGTARVAEGTAAVRALASGLGAVMVHEAGLPDGGLTVADVAWAITSVADLIAPGNSPMRLKSHTWVSQLDVHPDHIAVGGAVKALGDSDPTRFGDRRYYVLPGYWGDPDLSLVTDAWDTPANAGIRARAINACRAYGAWAPDRGSYAIGLHSKPDWFATVTATPKCLFHT
jgi:LmbE family N-acetylglucosaminyl deacetylase